MLKVGTHCDYCKQVDFLPFICKKCNKAYCSEHRQTHPCEPRETPADTVVSPKSTKTAAASKQVPSPAPKPQPSRLGSAASTSPKTGSTTGGSTPAKQNALDRLKAFMASKNSNRSNPGRSKSSASAPPKSSAQGDASVPETKRHYLYIRRAPRTVEDKVTGNKIQRPEKKLYVYYDKTKPIGHAVDKAKVSLSAGSSTGVELNGEKLPTSALIGGLPPDSVLTLTE